MAMDAKVWEGREKAQQAVSDLLVVMAANDITAFGCIPNRMLGFKTILPAKVEGWVEIVVMGRGLPSCDCDETDDPIQEDCCDREDCPCHEESEQQDEGDDIIEAKVLVKQSWIDAFIVVPLEYPYMESRNNVSKELRGEMGREQARVRMTIAAIRYRQLLESASQRLRQVEQDMIDSGFVTPPDKMCLAEPCGELSVDILSGNTRPYETMIQDLN